MSDKKKQTLFTNRELSWLEFNKRVLALAEEKSIPLAERFKFASIFASNLDEFFMVRVGSLYDCSLLEKHADEKENKTYMTPIEQLQMIMPRAAVMQEMCDTIYEDISQKLEKQNYRRVDFNNLSKKQHTFWKKYFINELFPVLSPQIIDKRHPFPFLRGSEVYVGAMITQKEKEKHSFGLIPVSAQFGRVVFVNDEDGVNYAYTEDLVLHFAELVFGKKALQSKCLFRVTRNADLAVAEGMFEHDIDYRTVMSELLKKRRKLAAVRLQTNVDSPQDIVNYLCAELLLPLDQVFEQTTPMDMSVGFKIASRLAQDGKADMFYPPKRPILPSRSYSLTQAVQKKDVLISYPFQSIRPFLNMLWNAANDPDVISIKMTLYRVASDSKIIEALCAAAENGKEVVAIVELRARFDEQNNINFSELLEESGCTVIYGFEEYKVHSKLCLITKLKGNKHTYISQIGTGNYNEKTSEQYTDLSFVTADEKTGTELATIFNDLAIEKITKKSERLLIAPLCFKSVLMQEMDEEIAAKKRGEEAMIVIKCNSVSDKDIIEKISEASCAGVEVKMVVRGICCFKAGVPDVTQNVTVRSIVGRYLEHSRIYSFGTGNNVRVYIASGDFLTRNTERRVEAGVKIYDKDIKEELRALLDLQLSDNVNATQMNPDGTYSKVVAQAGEPKIDCQAGMYVRLADAWGESEKTAIDRRGKKQSLFAKIMAMFKK